MAFRQSGEFRLPGLASPAVVGQEGPPMTIRLVFRHQPPPVVYRNASYGDVVRGLAVP